VGNDESIAPRWRSFARRLSQPGHCRLTHRTLVRHSFHIAIPSERGNIRRSISARAATRQGRQAIIPFELRQIDHVVLRIADLSRSLAFYGEALGCTIDNRQDAIGLVQLRAGSSLIDLVPLDGALGRLGGAGPGKEGRNVDHFALQITPFDDAAIRAHLAAFGVEVVQAGRRYGAEGEGPSIYVSDPDGNVVELKGPPDEG
jgi:catechol 2,3-dioxygenase-like lactoylglutathione lyase family enzyme